ncbi:MAG: LysR family transcriptional regulator [Rhodospirillaceae bacterium]|nr:LysR family transcriptional regulator [Rhodospirillaceae bacterium]
MDIATQMIMFATVVENGGFSAAARDLGLTPSAVSRQIGQLEDRLGTRLLNRSTRRISLTEVGRAFYARCADVSQSVQEAESLVLNMVDHPQGTLKVAATVAFAKAQLLPLLPVFLARNPDLKISLDATDRVIDLVEEQVDVAIRFSEQIDDSSVVSRKLATNRRVYVAAPSYVAEHGLPRTPDEVAGHNCLRISTVEAWNTWTFDDGTGPVRLPIKGNFEANSADAIYYAVLAGVGIARLSTYLVNDALAQGRLVRVLPDYADETSDILAIYSNKRNLSPNVRAFIDYFAEKFGPVPPWEKERAA